MLCVGEVSALLSLPAHYISTADVGQVHHLEVDSHRNRVYVHLHSGAIINGLEVSITSGNHVRIT